MNITTFVNKEGKEKKKPSPWDWKKPSYFRSLMNSLSIDTGRSKLIVIDIDAPAMEEWARIEQLSGGPFDTFTVSSGNAGMHVYFNAFDDPNINKTCAKSFVADDGTPLDIDLRGVGGVIFAPPSSYKTISGEERKYEVLRDGPVIDMPDELRRVLTARINPGATVVAAAKKKRSRSNSGEECEDVVPRAKKSGVEPAADERQERAKLLEKLPLNEGLRLEITKYIRGMSAKRAEGFDSWSCIIFTCCNIAYAYEFDDSVTIDAGLEDYVLGLAHTFSKKGGDKYDRDGVDNFFRGALGSNKLNGLRKHHYGVGTLKNAYHVDGICDQ